MTVSIIAAMAANRAIGLENRLPWRLPADLKRFKRLTLGHALILGRKTFESIGASLPGRTTFVVTRRGDYRAPGAEVAGSIDEAVAAAAAAGKDAWIAGGAEIYRDALSRGLADRLHLTVIDREFPGDVFFPDLDFARWRLVARAAHAEPFPYRFDDYERVRTAPSS